MVDVSGKAVTAREAVARGHIAMSAEALRQIRAGGMKKGDPLETARLAGIMAAKQTASLIPLCHPLPISHADVTLTAVRAATIAKPRADAPQPASRWRRYLVSVARCDFTTCSSGGQGMVTVRRLVKTTK